jgi:hypothetical protein
VAAGSRFAFVQLEFGWPLGPADGRYLFRPEPGADPERVIVLNTIGAPRRSRLRGRRPRAVEEADAEPVPVARVTLVRAEPFESAGGAARWLEELRGNAEALAAEVVDGLRRLNGVLRAHRVAAADPHGREVTREQALAVRVGYGDGEQVADGRFEAAYEVPLRRGGSRRTERLLPPERLAGLLGGHEELPASEELLLRARADLDAARPREAALQARIALEALLAEGGEGAAEAIAALGADRGPVGEAANAALAGDPPAELEAAVRGAVERMELAVRRRRLASTVDRPPR